MIVQIVRKIKGLIKMDAKQKAIKFLEKECKSSYIDVNKFEHYSTNNISMALDIELKEQTDHIDKVLSKLETLGFDGNDTDNSREEKSLSNRHFIDVFKKKLKEVD